MLTQNKPVRVIMNTQQLYLLDKNTTMVHCILLDSVITFPYHNYQLPQLQRAKEKVLTTTNVVLYFPSVYVKM